MTVVIFSASPGNVGTSSVACGSITFASDGTLAGNVYSGSFARLLDSIVLAATATGGSQTKRKRWFPGLTSIRR